MPRSLRSILMLAAQAAFVVILIAAWSLYAHSSQQHAFVAGTPSGTWQTLTGWITDGTLWPNIGATLAAAAGGYVVAVVLGTVIGVITGITPWLDRVLTPFFAFWNGFPRLAYYPFFAILLGYSLVSRMALVAFVIVFMIIANTAAGVREVDRVLLDNMRMLGAGRLELVRNVYVPSAGVWIMTSARLTVGWALQAAIVAEFIGATSGLGYLTSVGQNQFDTNTVWAAVFVVMVIAVLVDRLLYLLQRRLTRWTPT